LHEILLSVIYSIMTKIAKAGKEIKKALAGKCACYVLITCTEPGADGQMQVEMNYEGDEALAAFLIENAGQVFDDQRQYRESK
jgi:hypothetical protein